MGLVEAAVGVVPGGGGVKDTYFRWHAAKGNWDDAAWQTWMNLGYAATGSSPQLSARMQYFRDGHDETVMNRDRLLPRAIALVGELHDAALHVARWRCRCRRPRRSPSR